MNKNVTTIFIFLIFSGLLLGVASQALAANPAPLKLNLNYPQIPGGIDINTQQSLPQLIAWFYYLVIWISGFAAFVMIVWGGVQWMVSGGNPSSINDAKDKITNALLGILLILLSFIILQTINPDLTTLQIGSTT